MATTADSSAFSFNMPSIDVLKDFSDLSPDVRSHLARVYGALAMTVLAAAVGAYCHLLYHLGGVLSTVAVFALFFGVHSRSSPTHVRYAMLLGLGFCQGLSLGPLINAVLHIDDSIVVTAFASTTVAFASFSVSALVAQRRSFLYLGGVLGSALMMMFVIGLMNIFFQSEAVAVAQLYLGLLLFAGYIVYDTQVIVERASRGVKDYVTDALTLFIDFLAIFRRLLIILARNSAKKKNDRR